LQSRTLGGSEKATAAKWVAAFRWPAEQTATSCSSRNLCVAVNSKLPILCVALNWRAKLLLKTVMASKPADEAAANGFCQPQHCHVRKLTKLGRAAEAFSLLSCPIKSHTWSFWTSLKAWAQVVAVSLLHASKQLYKLGQSSNEPKVSLLRGYLKQLVL